MQRVGRDQGPVEIDHERKFNAEKEFLGYRGEFPQRGRFGIPHNRIAFSIQLWSSLSVLGRSDGYRSAFSGSLPADICD